MMKYLNLTLVTIIMFLANSVYGQQDIIGKWKTIDDSTGEPRSIVMIYTKGDKVYGKIDRILNEAHRNNLCDQCSGDDYNKPVEGLEIIKGLQKEGNEYEGGTITDPENGKVYRCKIWVDDDDPNTLNVRGYIAFLFRTQQWIKV